jgi:hypothetical protein
MDFNKEIYIPFIFTSMMADSLHGMVLSQRVSFSQNTATSIPSFVQAGLCKY